MLTWIKTLFQPKTKAGLLNTRNSVPPQLHRAVPVPARSPAMPPVQPPREQREPLKPSYPPQTARRVSSFPAAPSPVPAPDNTSDLMAGLMLAGAMSDTPAPASEPMRSGGGGDFGGGGAESSWSSPAPNPSPVESGGSSSD